MKLNKRLFTTKEAASYLGLAARTLYNGSGRKAAKPFPVKPRRFGRKLLWDKRDLDAWVDALPTG